MNTAQTALLERLRELIAETPTSGAVTPAKNPLKLTALDRVVAARLDDGDGLVTYVRNKVHEAPSRSCDALVAAGRSDLTLAAVVADGEAAWAPEFSDEDRTAAQARLASMLEAHGEARDALEADDVTYDRKIVAQVTSNRVAAGRPALTPEQEATMMARRAAARADAK